MKIFCTLCSLFCLYDALCWIVLSSYIILECNWYEILIFIMHRHILVRCIKKWMKIDTLLPMCIFLWFNKHLNSRTAFMSNKDKVDKIVCDQPATIASVIDRSLNRIYHNRRGELEGRAVKTTSTDIFCHKCIPDVLIESYECLHF